MRKTTPKKTGRPLIQIDWEEFDRLCEIQCTLTEIAHVLGVSEDTVERACKRDHKRAFAEHYAIKSTVGRKSLRRAQYDTAMGGGKGAVAMQIWLGKQWLGQTDKLDSRDVAFAREITQNLEDPARIREAIAAAEAAVLQLKKKLERQPALEPDNE